MQYIWQILSLANLSAKQIDKHFSDQGNIECRFGN